MSQSNTFFVLDSDSRFTCVTLNGNERGIFALLLFLLDPLRAKDVSDVILELVRLVIHLLNNWVNAVLVHEVDFGEDEETDPT